MKNDPIADANPKSIFLLPVFYALHMVEEFSLGFVEWADRYFGNFDWTQNLIGNAIFFVCLYLACHAYYKNSVKYLVFGMSGAMWVLSNAFIHISSVILGGEYSPGVVTATLLYIPGGLYLLIRWGKAGVLNAKNLGLSFAVGAMLFMIIPTFFRAILLDSQFAKIFHLASL
jgi:hypothetical protein